MKNTSLNEDLAMLGLPGLEEAKAVVQPEIYEVARELVDREYSEFSNDPEGYIRSMSWVKEEWLRIKELSGKLAFTKEDVDELARMLQKKKISTLEAAIEDDDAADYVVNLVARDIKKSYPKNKVSKSEADEGRRTRSIMADIQRGRLKSPYELQVSDVGKDLGHDFGQVMKQDVGKLVVYRNGILQMENPEQMKKRKGIKEDQLAGWKAGQKKLTEDKESDLEYIAGLIKDGYTSGFNPNWTLSTEIFEEGVELGDADREHIAAEVEKGMVEGELVIATEGDKTVRGWWKFEYIGDVHEGKRDVQEAKSEPLPGVSNVKSFLNINVNGNGYEASELYDYDRAVDNNGYFGITHLNVDKVIKFFEGKKIDVREFEKNILGSEFNSETFAKYRGTGDEHFIYSQDNDSESLMVIEKDEKYYLAIWANTVGFTPDGVCELSDEIDLRDYYGVFGISATITFDLGGKSYTIDADGQGDINMVDDLPEGFTKNLSDAQLWNALAAMQDNKPVQEAGEDELDAKQREWMLKEKKGDQKKPDWKSGDQVFFDRQGLLRGGVVRFISDGVARVAMSGAPARPDAAIAGLPVSRITQIVMVPIDQLYVTADEAKAGRQKRQDAARGLKTEVAAKSTVRYSRREWDGPICVLLDSEGKEVDRIDGAELLAAYCEEQGIEYDEEDWNDGSATVSLDGKEIDTIDGDILVDGYMDDQGHYIMEGRLQKKRQVSLGEDGRMLGIFTPQVLGAEKNNSKVVVYDNDGLSTDRYTVFIGDKVYNMCEHPLSAEGINEYSGTAKEIPMGSYNMGRKVNITDLPTDVQAAIRQRANLPELKQEEVVRDESWWDKVKNKPETAELFKQAEKLAKTIDREKYHNNKWVTEVGNLYVTTWWDFRSKNWITFPITKEDGYQEGDSIYTGNKEDAMAAHYSMVDKLKKELK